MDDKYQYSHKNIGYFSCSAIAWLHTFRGVLHTLHKKTPVKYHPCPSQYRIKSKNK